MTKSDFEMFLFGERLFLFAQLVYHSTNAYYKQQERSFCPGRRNADWETSAICEIGHSEDKS